jgi:hypothetical protein
MVRKSPANLRLVESPERVEVPQSGAVSSVQRAELDLPETTLDGLWNPEYLERLARAYWQHLNRISLRLLRVVYEPTARIVVLLFRPLALLRFHAPDYDVEGDRASVTWTIERGFLVSKQGRGQGFLRIAVERVDGAKAGEARLRVSAEVQNFYPWLRGSGRFARFGTWLYGQTQVRIHEIVTKRFLRSLASLDLPPSRVGALAAEIEAGDAR